MNTCFELTRRETFLIEAVLVPDSLRLPSGDPHADRLTFAIIRAMSQRALRRLAVLENEEEDDTVKEIGLGIYGVPLGGAISDDFWSQPGRLAEIRNKLEGDEPLSPLTWARIDARYPPGPEEDVLRCVLSPSVAVLDTLARTGGLAVPRLPGRPSAGGFGPMVERFFSAPSRWPESSDPFANTPTLLIEFVSPGWRSP